MTIVLFVGFGLVLSYEIYAAVKNEDPTISEYVWSISTRRPFLPFSLGVLMGHFFA